MAEEKEYTFSLSGYGLGGETQAAAGDTDGEGKIQTVLGTTKGHMVVLDSAANSFSLRDFSRVGSPIYSLDIVSPEGSEPNGILAGVHNYAHLYEWTGREYEKKGNTQSLGSRVLDLASSDLNKDGKMEVVVTAEKAGLQIYRKQASSLNKIWNRKPHSITRASVGDINGDGTDEVVMIDITERLPLNLSVLKSDNRTFVVDSENSLGQRIAGPILTADVDGDRKAEVIVTGPKERRFFVFKVVNKKLVRLHVSDPLPGAIVGFAAGDMDGDGRVELVIATASEVCIFRWNGKTFFPVNKMEVTREIVILIVRDVNFDKVDEIIVGTVDGRFFVLRPSPVANTQFLVSEDVWVPRDMPPIKEALKVKVENAHVVDVDRFATGVFIRGVYDVDVLYAAKPDGRVYSFSTRIPFSVVVRTPAVFGPISFHNVHIEVEYVTSRFDRHDRKKITVIIVSKVVLFNFRCPSRISLGSLSKQVGVPKEIIAELNGLDLNTVLNENQPLLLPGE